MSRNAFASGAIYDYRMARDAAARAAEVLRERGEALTVAEMVLAEAIANHGELYLSDRVYSLDAAGRVVERTARLASLVVLPRDDEPTGGVPGDSLDRDLIGHPLAADAATLIDGEIS